MKLENLLSKKWVWILNFALLGIFFYSRLLNSLSIGGRWDLNEHIAFAYRIKDGLLSYSSGAADLFMPSSPYFPGVGLLSYFLSLFNIDIFANNQILLCLAVSIGAASFILIYKLTRKIYPQIPPISTLCLLSIFYIIFLRSYSGYMIEFKPDTILLVASLSILFLLDSKFNFNKLILASFILFFVSFFKQSAFLVYFLAFIFIFFNAFLSSKQKLLILSFFMFIGLSALGLIFSIDNVYFFTMQVMSYHSFVDLDEFLGYVMETLLLNSPFLVALLVALCTRFKALKTSKLKSIESKYFIFCLAWFIYYFFISTAKIGSNTGNTEVGLVVFFPFVIFGAYAIYNFLARFSNILQVCVIAMLALLLAYHLNGAIKHTKAYANSLTWHKEVKEYLMANFKDKSALVNGNTLIPALKAGIKNIGEFETMGHFLGDASFDTNSITSLFEKQIYDVIILDSMQSLLEADSKINKSILDSYIELKVPIQNLHILVRR